MVDCIWGKLSPAIISLCLFEFLLIQVRSLDWVFNQLGLTVFGLRWFVGLRLLLPYYLFVCLSYLCHFDNVCYPIDRIMVGKSNFINYSEGCSVYIYCYAIH